MPFVAPAPIDTERLIVRPVVDADLPALMAVNSDPMVTAHLPYATWTSPADGEAWLARMRAIEAGGAALQFVAVLRSTQEAIGTCLLFRLDEGSARAELGYALGRVHWGRGVMREALTAVLGHAFGAMSVRRIEAEIDPRNVASTRLVQRLGFTREGLLRQRWMTKGRPTDVEIHGLLRSEWPHG